MMFKKFTLTHTHTRFFGWQGNARKTRPPENRL